MPSFPSGWSPTTCDHTAPRPETLGSNAGMSAGDGVESTTGAVAEGGKTRTVPRAEAIAIQLVRQAAKGDPKGLAAIMSLTREFDAAVGELRPNVLTRAE